VIVLRQLPDARQVVRIELLVVRLRIVAGLVLRLLVGALRMRDGSE
jgi:hypothetical protein